MTLTYYRAAARMTAEESPYRHIFIFSHSCISCFATLEQVLLITSWPLFLVAHISTAIAHVASLLF